MENTRLSRRVITFYDAFAGIGGFRLGLERAGFKCVGSCEIDDYARRVYHKNFGEWPDRDIRDVSSINGADMLCGGFPCQDISVAGKGAGLSGERSGLWWELARIIENCQPRWVFLENVPALTNRGLGEVLGCLADGGYDAEWDCLPASAFGAPHQRDRIWIIAHTKGQLWNGGTAVMGGEDQESAREPRGSYWREHKPPIRRMDDGIPSALDLGGVKEQDVFKEMPIHPREVQRWLAVGKRVDRLRCLGNAVVPQVVEWIGRRILEAEQAGEE